MSKSQRMTRPSLEPALGIPGTQVLVLTSSHGHSACNPLEAFGSSLILCTSRGNSWVHLLHLPSRSFSWLPTLPLYQIRLSEKSQQELIRPLIEIIITLHYFHWHGIQLWLWHWLRKWGTWLTKQHHPKLEKHLLALIRLKVRGTRNSTLKDKRPNIFLAPTYCVTLPIYVKFCPKLLL